MVDESVIEIAETLSMIGILLAFVIFARLALKARSIGSLRFQLSIFMLLWTIAEFPHVLDTLGYLSTAVYSSYGQIFHLLSMASFAVFVGWRSILFLRHNPPASLSPFPSIAGIDPSNTPSTTKIGKDRGVTE